MSKGGDDTTGIITMLATLATKHMVDITGDSDGWDVDLWAEGTCGQPMRVYRGPCATPYLYDAVKAAHDWMKEQR